MRKPIYQVFKTPAYTRVRTEEGDYDAFSGYNIVASCENEVCCEDYLYTGGAEFPVIFDSEGADKAVGQIEDKGSINADDYWDHINTRLKDALPDYVLNPHRPEYN